MSLDPTHWLATSFVDQPLVIGWTTRGPVGQPGFGSKASATACFRASRGSFNAVRFQSQGAGLDREAREVAILRQQGRAVSAADRRNLRVKDEMARRVRGPRQLS